MINKQFNKMTNRMTNKLAALALMMLALVSCSKDKDKDKSFESAKYALITRTTNADGRSYAGYMQKIESPDVAGTIDNSKATEISPSYKGAIVQFNKAIYINDYGHATVTRYTLSDGNVGTKTGFFDVKDLGNQGNLVFKDENTAYIGGMSTKIIIFNPTTMVKTGIIDWSSLSKMGQVTDFPTPGAKVNAEIITEIIINGNYMYAAICYMNDFGTYTPATPGCGILVIDLSKVNNSDNGNAEAMKTAKIITNTKGSYTGAWNSSGGVSFMNKTENGDIYMLCHNSFGGARKVMDKPACLLRIKNGTTEFDDYYFDLETASAGNGSPVMNFEYYGNGKFLACVMDTSKLDPKNPYSFNTDPIFRWYNFDLTNKTATKVDDEYTTAGKVAKCFFANGFAYVPFANKDANYINKINLSDFTKKTKTVTTTGMPNIVELK